MKKTYNMEVDCANCANKMELAANNVEGVEKATVNYFAQKMTVEFKEGYAPAEVMPQILKVCRKVESDCTIEF